MKQMSNHFEYIKGTAGLVLLMQKSTAICLYVQIKYQQVEWQWHLGSSTKNGKKCKIGVLQLASRRNSANPLVREGN